MKKKMKVFWGQMIGDRDRDNDIQREMYLYHNDRARIRTYIRRKSEVVFFWRLKKQ